MMRLLTVSAALVWAMAALVSASEPDAEASGEQRAGEVALAAQDWATAESSFRSALSTDPASIEARIGLARALAGAGDPPSATAELTRAADRESAVGAYGRAARLLEVAADLRPGDPNVLAALGRVLVLDRRYLAAEPPLARAYDSATADAETPLYYAAALWENGKIGPAETVLRAALEAGDDDFAAAYQLGRLLSWQGRHAEAVAYLERCVAVAPRAVDVRLDLARALDGAGEGERAIAAYRRAIELAPDHSELRYGLGMALVRAGEREAGKAELATFQRLYAADQRRTRDQGLAAARVARGLELLAGGDVEGAVEHLSGLPASVDALAALATARRAAGDLEGAAAELERALELDASRTDLRARLNEIRLELLSS